jgi:photosystem II stability/assembly factor-like uncharacterized protein
MGGQMISKSMRTALATAVLATCAFGAAPADAAVSTSNSGWFWGDPRPQGNTLGAIDFAEGRGYAVGGFGTLVRTDDGGSTWSGIITGVGSARLTDVDAVDANTVVVGGGCILRRSTDGGTSFQRLPFTSSERNCPAEVRAFSFPSPDTGYVLVSDGTMLRTDDGGRTFSRKTAVPGTLAGAGIAEPSDIFFTSATRGFASTRQGNLYRTTDGAESWTLVANDAAGFNDINFIGTTGFAVGPSNNLHRSDDNGDMWTKRPLAGAPVRTLLSISCADPATCLIATEQGDVLIRTTDGGDTGSAVTPSTLRIFAVGFSSATRAVAVGERGATSVSDDAGQNFATVGGRITGGFTRLRATSPAIAHAAGSNGTVARTTDGGQTWGTIGVSTSEDIVDVSFPDVNTGFALDTSNTGFRTDNGGGSWRILNTGGESANAIHALDANVILVAGRGIRRSSDGGDTFGDVGGRAARRATFVDLDSLGNAVFAFGSRALMFSPNGGANWRSVRRPPGRLADVDFVSSRAGFALTTNDRLWRTSNRGRRWSEVRSTGADFATEIAFTSAREGYLANPGGLHDRRAGGFIYRTEDGGRTWRPQLVSFSRFFGGGLVSAGATDFALDANDNLFATNTGGDAGTATSLRLSARRRTVSRRQRAVLRGVLNPAEGGEEVVLSYRRVRGGSWAQREATVASNGSFTIRLRLRRTSVIVVQWRGDDDRRGAGSPPVTVRVR